MRDVDPYLAALDRELPGIVKELRAQLQRMLTEPYETPITGNEAWENREVLTEQWRKQRPLLKPRIDMADTEYAKLLDKFNNDTFLDVFALATGQEAWTYLGTCR